MSRRRNRRRNRHSNSSQPSNNRTRGTQNRLPNPPQHPRPRNSFSAGFTGTPFAQRRRPMAPAPTPPSSIHSSATPSPSTPSPDTKIKVDITYSSGRHYSVYLPPPGEGGPLDAKLELVSWDGEGEREKMQWEHVCPLVLYRRSGGGCIFGRACGEPMEWRREPDLGELVDMAKGEGK